MQRKLIPHSKWAVRSIDDITIGDTVYCYFDPEPNTIRKGHVTEIKFGYLRGNAIKMYVTGGLLSKKEDYLDWIFDEPLSHVFKNMWHAWAYALKGPYT